ncbi:MAG TPA: hypothetical protein VK324_11530 [Tepidisphaeraceae bacterium]|nr:hypothetical protein [Tepidisphaeraceae bacterium]
MWFDARPAAPDWSDAQRQLSRADPAMRDLIRRVGPCTLAPRRDHFVVLCQSIYNQQLSTAAATTLFNRFRDLFPRRRPTPPLVKDALSGGIDEPTLKTAGLSRQKRAYVLDLATHFVDGRIDTARLKRLPDEQVIAALTQVNGIGRWTAEMFLMFVLNRPDVFPVDDLGLQEGVRREYELTARPTPKQLLPLGEPWRPWRTVATWYLWRGGDQ